MSDQPSDTKVADGEDMFVELFTLFGDKLDAQSTRIDRLIEAVEDTRAELQRQAAAQAKTAELLRQLIGVLMSDQINTAVAVQLMKQVSTTIDDKLINETAAASLGRFRGMGWINLVVAYEKQAAELEKQRTRREEELASGTQRMPVNSERRGQVEEEIVRKGEERRTMLTAGEREPVAHLDQDRSR
jgi:cysteinyl-tRNA synthetase